MGLAFILPALSAGFAWAIWKRQLRPKAWLAIVLMLAVLLGAGLVALNTGHAEEERVEGTVPASAIATHEALAEQFLWITGITLAISAVVLLLRRPLPMRVLSAATVLGTFLIAGAALRVGHAGGELVYVHNAAAAYASTNTPSQQVADKKIPSSPKEAPARDAEDDR
jgi:hypothetical protein